jgi:hypothetical protein
MAQFLYDHPRMMGVLFTLVLLTQVGVAAAGDSGSVGGA